MSKKAKPTKTLNPLHFEDLDPHRFEDLVRNLIYDFKRWRSIEATGRGGGDEGFDVRAWEQTHEVINVEGDDDEKGIHPMEGNLWKMQCKREKKLGPSKVKKIIDDGVDKNTPPYGYILVAPTNFSKQSHDTFRNELRKRGVMEFYLWGKAKLEDMLYLPKNDHILFAFFGISLVTKKRSKITELRFTINNKNKLSRILSGGDYIERMRKSILIRDYNDTHYPYENEYSDFDKRPRWKEHIVTGYHPLGLIVQVNKYFAFANLDKKEWDYTKTIDLVCRQSEQEQRGDQNFKTRRKVEDFYKYLPRDNQAKLIIEGLLSFEDILLIDDKGDKWHKYPHIYIDFRLPKGPFKGFFYILTLNGWTERRFYIDDRFKRIKVFPRIFPEIKKGKVYSNKSVTLDSASLHSFRDGSPLFRDLLDIDGKYSFLNVRDIIPVSGGEKEQEKLFMRVTYKYRIKVKDYLTKRSIMKERVESQVGRNVKNNESLTIFEFEKVYDWQINESK